jgi:hypothetical protein
MFLGLVFFHVSVCKTSKTSFLINENGKSFALFQKKVESSRSVQQLQREQLRARIGMEGAKPNILNP